MNKKQLNAFKDGTADALLKGYKSDLHEDLYYYKQGYDFGLYLYNQQDPNADKYLNSTERQHDVINNKENRQKNERHRKLLQ